MLALAEVSAAELKRSCGEEAGFVCRHVLEWTGSEEVAEIAQWSLDVPLKIVAIALGALVISWMLRRAIGKALRRLHSGGVGERFGAMRRGVPQALRATEETSLRAEQRIEALTGMLRSLATFIVWTIAAFMVLGAVGIDLAPLLAGAGVIGVALGFGSQSLVRDFLSGTFILVEDQFGVGDIIDVSGEVSGVVEAVTLRTTRLRSVDGVVWHVPNGEIRMVGNMSQHWSRTLLDVEVAYDTDIEQAKSEVKRVADRLWKEDPAVLEEPEMWGVEQLGASGIVLRLVVKTTPKEQWRVARRLREQIKLAFDEAGIEIPFPQQTVWHRGDEAAGSTPPS
ncbi:MAG: mechanosensitive ion channel family protein [Solirubrobacterales bacterium]